VARGPDGATVRCRPSHAVGGWQHNARVSTTPLHDLVDTSEAVAATSARLAKINSLAELLRRLGPADVAIGVAFLAGELRQRQIGVGYAALRDRRPPAVEPTLTVGEVDAAFGLIGRQSGAGSQRERRRLLADLLGRATAAEQFFLAKLISGELRQGALDGVMVEAIARAAAVPAAEVRRAAMLRGSLPAVAEAALAGGIPALREFGLEVGRPVRPMLAQSADTVTAALERLGSAAVEWKLDGVRLQIHRDGSDVAVFTRTLDDITTRVPEVVGTALALPVKSAVLDAEVIALRADSRPQPFAVTASRVGSKVDIATVQAAAPLTAFVFDLLHLDGRDLLDEPAAERYAALASVAPPQLLIPRVVTDDPAVAERFFLDTVKQGHEGVVAKSLDQPYAAGSRGAGWIKVKPRHTLDLVILAAEWGHGRRRGWLSNLHLGARDPAGGWVMLGKTFKGLTDDMLTWQTEQLLGLAVERNDWVVRVRPELVVEVAFDGVQSSPRYPGGLALRFARVLHHRPDKRADDADTIDTVRAIGAAIS
jgi:DNA ligase-1